MSENNENTTEKKPSILTNAMLRIQNKTTQTTVPNEDANAPKKTLKPRVAFALGVVAAATSLYVTLKIAASTTEVETSSEDDSENTDI
jgi:hypothetical protein